jgi:hypothetical protein
MENGDSPGSRDHRGIPVFSSPASRAGSRDGAGAVELCDRVIVLQHGRIVDTLDGDRLTEPELSLAMNAGFADPV